MRGLLLYAGSETWLVIIVGRSLPRTNRLQQCVIAVIAVIAVFIQVWTSRSRAPAVQVINHKKNFSVMTQLELENERSRLE